MKVLVINGPNLNWLGKRDVKVYGPDTLADIEGRIQKRAKELGHECIFFQSNSEGAIIDCIQAHSKDVAAIIINPGAFGAYAYAISDALGDAAKPIAEVHLSNVFAREPWRHKSVIAPIARGVVSGFGWRGYVAALEMLVALASEKR